MRKDKSNNLPVSNPRPKGGFAKNPIKSERHGKDGTISLSRKAKKSLKVTKDLKNYPM